MGKNFDLPSSENKIQKFEWGYIKWLHEPKDLQVERMSAALVTFYPRKKQVKHLHAGEEQIMYVVSGKGYHRLNGDEHLISKGMVFHCPPYSIHEVVNTEDEPLEILLFYSPSKARNLSKSLTPSLERNSLCLEKLVNKDVLFETQERYASDLGICLGVYDSNHKPITSISNQPGFCRIMEQKGNKNCHSNTFSLDNLTKEKFFVFECCCNLKAVAVPVFINGFLAGYIKSGPFMINSPEKNVFEKIQSVTKTKKALDEFRKLRPVPKSRIYAVVEALNEMSISISEIVKKEFSDKIQIEYKDSVLEYPLDKEKGIIQKIKAGDREGAVEFAKQFLNELFANGYSLSQIKDAVVELLAVILRVIPGDVVSLSEIDSLRKKYRKEIWNSSDIENLAKRFYSYILDIAELCNDKLFFEERNAVIEAIECIKRNYKQKLSLEMVAQSVYLSPNYFSYLFKEQTGYNFIDYLTNVRLTEAKRLLKYTKKPIKKISEEVGYNDPSYFGMVFKRVVGMTPGQYRCKSAEEKHKKNIQCDI